MEYASNVSACKFNHDKNALKYEKQYSKLGVVCTGIPGYTCIYWYILSWQIEWSAHKLLIFVYRILCKVCGLCMHAYSDIGKSPSSMKILGVIDSIYHGYLRISTDIQGWEWESLGCPRISKDIHFHPGISRWYTFQMSPGQALSLQSPAAAHTLGNGQSTYSTGKVWVSLCVDRIFGACCFLFWAWEFRQCMLLLPQQQQQPLQYW